MIPVKRQAKSEDQIKELCAFCFKPTPYWSASKARLPGEQVACCQACGRLQPMAALPSKAEWFKACEEAEQAERELADNTREAERRRIARATASQTSQRSSLEERKRPWQTQDRSWVLVLTENIGTSKKNYQVTRFALTLISPTGEIVRTTTSAVFYPDARADAKVQAVQKLLTDANACILEPMNP